MNKQINLPLILILIFSCSEDGAIIISNTPTELPGQNYKINLHSNSGSFLETVTINWNETEGVVELDDSGTLINPDGSSHTFSDMTAGEFRNITIQVIRDDSTYVDSIQIFTRPVYPVSNFRYEVEMVMHGNGQWDEGENLTVDWNENEAFDLKSYDEYDDLDGDSMWSVGDTLIVDFNNNNEYDEYEADEFDDADELDNSKLTLKLGLQYKMPEPNITIGLNLDYAKAVDHLKTEQDDPVFKAKLAIKFGF